MEAAAAAAARAESTATTSTTSTPFTVVTSPLDADTPAAASNGTRHDAGSAVAAGGEPASHTSDISQRPALAGRATSSGSTGSNNARKDTFDFEPGAHDAFYEAISASLKKGTHMLKVSAKKVQRRLVRIKPEAGQLLWESKHAGILNIENIRELRFGADARGFREQFKVAPDCEPRWMSIIYTSSGRYKILHLVALTTEDFKLWRDTLETLYDQRKELMGGLDQMRKRQAVWLKQHWSNADINEDQKLDMRDVETLCRNLNISASAKAIQTNFEKADVKKRGFLDFADFQLFVKYLRRRPEVEDLMRSLSGTAEFVPLDAFKSFLKTTQRSGLSEETIEAIYAKFSETKADASFDHSKTTLMTADGFTSFLVSSDNMAFSERQLRVCDDMTRPLCEYYLSSSHNTYLVGGQLTGSSTAEGYIRALQQGCRTVELDVWDGPDEPVVYHGRTLTSRLPVRDALAAIAKYAFVASPYPVILSMEVHCDYTQQEKLAEILRSTLGKALVDCPLYGESINEHLAGVPNVERLPSPEDLKYRILVKAKNLFVIKEAAKPGEPLVEVSEDSSNSSSDSDIKKAFNSALRMIRPNASPSLSPPNSSKQATFNFGPSGSNTGPAPSERQQPTALPAPNLERQLSRTTSRDTRRLSLSRLRSRSDTSTQSSVGSTGTGEGRREKQPLMSIALAGLIVYTVGVKWRGLNKKEQYEPSHIVSLGERRLNKLIKDARKDLIAHCRTHLVRTYPAGTRFTSSNYLPYNYWAVGLQLVSLNWQTYDLGLELNTAFFQRNGRSGYILKPELLRSKREADKDKVALRLVERYLLHVEVLSAQQLPKPKVHDPSSEPFTNADSEDEKAPSAFATVSPLVEITLHAPSPSGDPDEDNTSPPSSASSHNNNNKDKDRDRESTATTRTYKTATVAGNGFNPVFTSSKFQIPFSVPPDMLDLAFLRFNVLAKIGGDEFGLGRYAVSLGVLMPGYRHIPLYDHLGQQYLFSSLFIYTQLRAVS